MLASMNEVTLVHLVNDESLPGLTEALGNTNFMDLLEIQIETDPARTCQKIAQATTGANLIFIAMGEACNQLPAIALAQRANKRKILSYHLIVPTLPAFTESWPQAPVTAYFPTGSTIPKDITLHGINVAEFSDLPTFARFIDNCLP